jgi:ubiquinone/menaquinone biosynthesis C-methylase UbiE
LTLKKNNPSQDHLWWRLVRFGFRLLYNEMAWTYDTVSWAVSLGQWREWQRAGISFLVGRHVLELAHGPGHMLPELEASGFEVVGLDLSEAMGRMARARLRRTGMIVPLVRASAHSLPFAADVFDSAFATFPTDFIADERTISSLYRALKPEGRLVIVLGARLTSGSLLGGVIEWLSEITGQREFPDAKEPHSEQWHLARQRFLSAGFSLEIEQVELSASIVTIAIAYKRAKESPQSGRSNRL